MKLNYYLLPVAAVIFTGCSSLPSDQSEAVRRGIYAARDASDAGRFDLSDRYLHDTARLVPPPKTPIHIRPVQ